MIFVDSRTTASGQTILEVHGDLVIENLSVLTAAVDAQQGAGPPVLDLGEVRFADAAAVDQLRRWLHERVTLRGGSLYLQALLRR